MARIRLLELEQMESDVAEMCRGIAQLTGDSTALRAIAHRPDIVRAFTQFYWPLQTQGRFSRKLVELVRLSVAQINQCKNCLGGRYQDACDQGLTEAMIAELPRAQSSSLFDAREKAAIGYAQAMATNHYAVGDAEFARLHAHFDEGEIVELCMLVAQFIGVGRMFAVLDATNTACRLGPASTTA